MTWQIFTTMDQNYYDHIGKEMIDSWLHYWPNESNLIVYTEGKVDLPIDSRIICRNWEQSCQPWFDNFCQQRSGAETKFAKKGLVWCDFLFQNDSRCILWLDADVVTLRPIRLEIFDLLLGDYLAAMFDNSPSPEVQTIESGVVMLNTQHEKYHSFRDLYRYYYQNIVMPELSMRFYDGEVLGNSIFKFRDHVNVLNATQVKQYGNPLKRHGLGQYLRHFKGRSKHHHDNMKEYWKEGTELNYNPLLPGQQERAGK